MIRSRLILLAEAVTIVAGFVLLAWTIVPLDEYKTRRIPLEPDVANPEHPENTSGIWILMRFSVWPFGGEFSGVMAMKDIVSIPYSSLWWGIVSKSEYERFEAYGGFYTANMGRFGLGCAISGLHLAPGTYYLILKKDRNFDEFFDVSVYSRIRGGHGVLFIPGMMAVSVAFPLLVVWNEWKKRERDFVLGQKPPN